MTAATPSLLSVVTWLVVIFEAGCLAGFVVSTYCCDVHPYLKRWLRHGRAPATD